MANVVHKTTLRLLLSVNTPDYSTDEWLINPASLGSLIADNVSNRYWKIAGDDVAEMTRAEKEVVDEALAAENSASEKQHAQDEQDGSSGTSRALRATIKALVDELNTLRSWVREFTVAVEASNSLGQLKSEIAALPNMPDRTYAQARQAITSRIEEES